VKRWTTGGFYGLSEDEECGEWVLYEEADAEIRRLRDVIEMTHTLHCTPAWTDRGLHAPECLLYEIDP
jgi:hypothetical protein